MSWPEILKTSLIVIMLAAGLSAGPATAFQGIPEADDEATGAVEPSEPPPPPYYVEFRVAENGLYGHSYIAYGRLNEAGQPANAIYADLHPTGALPSLLLGHFVPMKAATTPARATPHRKIASRYLRSLSEAEYQTLIAVIERIRAAPPDWSIVSYNCNDFVAEVARGIGLQTPNTLTLPYEFVPELQAMNESEPVAPGRISPNASRPVPPAAVPIARPPTPATRSSRPAAVPRLSSGLPARLVPPAPIGVRTTAFAR